MVKDAGLSCRYIISKKPEGAPVTERAIPLAIFESEPAVRRHYLRRWLKDNTMTDFDIRKVLDWNYYIERLGGTIQKIITIPAALQSVPNPVPRIQHPDWLHKKIMEKNDTLKQRKINEMFTVSAKPKSTAAPSPDGVEEGEEDLFANVVSDIEDVGKKSGRTPLGLKNVAVTHKRKRDDPPHAAAEKASDDHLSKSWRQALGNPPPRSKVREWIAFQKKKWEYQARQKQASSTRKRAKVNARGDDEDDEGAGFAGGGVIRSGPRATLGGFLRRTQRTLLDTPWQVIQVVETGAKGGGLFKVWAMVGSDLHCIKLSVPRIFYVNQRTAKEESAGAALWRKVQKTLPRSHPVLNLYEYRVPEELFRAHASDLVTDLSTPDIEGIYETQVPLDFRVLVDLGCLCAVDKQRARELARASADVDTFELGWMQFKTLAHYHYLPERSFRTIYFYHHKVGNKALLGLFVPTAKKGSVFVVDTVRSNQMPNLNAMYNSERGAYINKGGTEGKVPEGDYAFEVRVETDLRQVHRQIQRLLTAYREEKRGPTLLVVQSCADFQVCWTRFSNQNSAIVLTVNHGLFYPFQTLTSAMPVMSDFPMVPIHVSDSDTLYNVLDWQRKGAQYMLRHYLKSDAYLQATIEQCRYFHVPVGNLPRDNTAFGADLFYARHLRKQNFVLWCSPSDKPDLGGKEADDNRLLTETDDTLSSIMVNSPGAYRTVCVEIELDALAVNTLLQSHHVNDIEGTAGSVAFDTMPQVCAIFFMGHETGNYIDGLRNKLYK